MTTELDTRYKTCKACQENSLSKVQKKLEVIPIFLDKLAPNEVICLDFGVYSGINILFLKDRYSSFNRFWVCKNKSTQEVITHPQSYMNLFGLPHKIVHDGGRCFPAAFAEFLEANHVNNHDTSSFRPSSNGAIERGVRSLKDVLGNIEGHITKELIEELAFAINNHVTIGQGTASMRVLGRSQRCRVAIHVS